MDVPGLLVDSLDLMEKVIAYVKDVKNAPKELRGYDPTANRAFLCYMGTMGTEIEVAGRFQESNKPIDMARRQDQCQRSTRGCWTFMKQHLILVLQDDVRQLSISIKDDIFFLSQILGLVREEIHLLSKAEHDRRTQAILEWLSPLSSNRAQAAMKEKLMSRTGLWFIGSDQVQNILEQLIESTLPLSDEISQSFIDHEEGRAPLTWNEIRKLLLTVSRRIDRTYIGIDALDEFEALSNPQDLLDALSELHQAGHINVMIFSHTNQAFNFHGRSSSRLDIEASMEDLQRYLNDYVIPKMDQDFLRHHSDLHKSIVDNVSKSARGIAKDVKDLVENLTTRGDILAKIYGRTINRITTRTSSAKVLRLLAWVTFATRPLTQQEIACAFAVRPNDTQLDEEGCPDVSLMISCAGGLLKMDESSGVIRLVHLTVQEYLKTHLPDVFPSPELDMAKTCLTYLSMDKYMGPSGGGDNSSASNFTDAFIEYVATSWGDHLRSHAPVLAQETSGTALASLDDETMSQVNTFWSAENRVCDAFLINETFYKGEWISGFSQTALQWAARLDRVSIAKLLISAGADTNDASTSWPCLHQAAGAGFLEKGMVELLLDSGANIDAKASAAQQRTALGRACFHGRADMALLLLRRGANPLILDKAGDTAMGAAMLGPMDEDIVRGLLEAAAKLPEQDRHLILSFPDRAEYGVRPLHRAACANHLRIAMMMVDFISQQLSDPSILDLTNEHNKTALMDAAQRAFPSIVEILVEAGANLHIRSRKGRNCLECAVFGGEWSSDRARVVQILLNANEELVHGPRESKTLQRIRDNCP
ncbi:hypothetical protein BDV97DRAFT_387598 [Delphinella strobiligena]|nr:hypothetical protein BDV97DRAFT_387598 [Delphinella strobiligena]